MLQIEYVYWLCGALLLAAGCSELRGGRYAHAAFWTLLALTFFGGDAVESASRSGDALPAQCVGVSVIVLGLIAGSGRLARRHRPDPETDIERRRQNAVRLRNRLFAPALVIPAATVVLIVLAPYLRIGDVNLLDAHQPALIALGAACVIAAVCAMSMTRASPVDALRESSRLLDALSWALLLPMLLATLGAVFAATGVGNAVAHIVSAAIPTDSRDACVFAYAVGMALFTVVMGNAFAAFPVMTAGIGLPLLVTQHHAHAAVVGALGMLCGYCGTLLTPMAANFNIVPVALLELSDTNAVIRAQWPTAVALFATNLLLLDWLAFR